MNLYTTCDTCHTNTATYACSVCGDAFYCSKECQEEDWFLNNHNVHCKNTVNKRIEILERQKAKAMMKMETKTKTNTIGGCIVCGQDQDHDGSDEYDFCDDICQKIHRKLSRIGANIEIDKKYGVITDERVLEKMKELIVTYVETEIKNHGYTSTFDTASYLFKNRTEWLDDVTQTTRPVVTAVVDTVNYILQSQLYDEYELRYEQDIYRVPAKRLSGGTAKRKREDNSEGEDRDNSKKRKSSDGLKPVVIFSSLHSEKDYSAYMENVHVIIKHDVEKNLKLEDVQRILSWKLSIDSWYKTHEKRSDVPEGVFSPTYTIKRDSLQNLLSYLQANDINYIQPARPLMISGNTNVKSVNTLMPVPPDYNVNVLSPGESTGNPSLFDMTRLSKFFPKVTRGWAEFNASYVYTWGWLMYLKEVLKVDGVSFCTSKGYLEPGTTFVFDVVEVVPTLTAPTDILKDLYDCKKESASRFFISQFTISQNRGYHANAIIFDLENAIITRFDPHGETTLDLNPLTKETFVNINDYMLDWVENTLNKSTGMTWTYRPSRYVCMGLKTESVQGRDSVSIYKNIIETIETKWIKPEKVREISGFCTVWSLLYVHIRITHPELSDQQIATNVSKWSDVETSARIRQYTYFIVKTINTTEIRRKLFAFFKPGDKVKHTEYAGYVFGFDNKMGKLILFVGKVRGVSVKKTSEYVLVDPEDVHQITNQDYLSFKYRTDTFGKLKEYLNAIMTERVKKIPVGSVVYLLTWENDDFGKTKIEMIALVVGYDTKTLSVHIVGYYDMIRTFVKDEDYKGIIQTDTTAFGIRKYSTYHKNVKLANEDQNVSFPEQFFTEARELPSTSGSTGEVKQKLTLNEPLNVADTVRFGATYYDDDEAKWCIVNGVGVVIELMSKPDEIYVAASFNKTWFDTKNVLDITKGEEKPSKEVSEDYGKITIMLHWVESKTSGFNRPRFRTRMESDTNVVVKNTLELLYDKRREENDNFRFDLGTPVMWRNFDGPDVVYNYDDPDTIYYAQGYVSDKNPISGTISIIAMTATKDFYEHDDGDVTWDDEWEIKYDDTTFEVTLEPYENTYEVEFGPLESYEDMEIKARGMTVEENLEEDSDESELF